jgi:hypothetical protein
MESGFLVKLYVNVVAHFNDVRLNHVRRRRGVIAFLDPDRAHAPFARALFDSLHRLRLKRLYVRRLELKGTIAIEKILDHIDGKFRLPEPIFRFEALDIFFA